MQNTTQTFSLPQLVDAARALAALGVSRATFYRLVKSGDIGPGVKLGRHFQSPRRWAAEEIEQFAARGVK